MTLPTPQQLAREYDAGASLASLDAKYGRYPGWARNQLVKIDHRRRAPGGRSTRRAGALSAVLNTLGDQTEQAEALGVALRTVSYWHAGTKMPSSRVLARLPSALRTQLMDALSTSPEQD
jgi:hypothetical protein